jgi:hypothetical protein
LLLFLLKPTLRVLRRYHSSVDRHTSRTFLLRFGALLAMMLLTTMAPSLLRLLPASHAMQLIDAAIALDEQHVRSPR